MKQVIFSVDAQNRKREINEKNCREKQNETEILKKQKSEKSFQKWKWLEYSTWSCYSHCIQFYVSSLLGNAYICFKRGFCNVMLLVRSRLPNLGVSEYWLRRDYKNARLVRHLFRQPQNAPHSHMERNVGNIALEYVQTSGALRGHGDTHQSVDKSASRLFHQRRAWFQPCQFVSPIGNLE